MTSANLCRSMPLSSSPFGILFENVSSIALLKFVFVFFSAVVAGSSRGCFSVASFLRQSSVVVFFIFSCKMFTVI